MSTAPFDPRFDPPDQDRLGPVHTVIALLCVAVFFLLARGCSSACHAPERQFTPSPASIPNIPIARSNST